MSDHPTTTPDWTTADVEELKQFLDEFLGTTTPTQDSGTKEAN